MNRMKKNSGQSVLEVLIALTIFVVSVATSFQVFFGGQSISIDSHNASSAGDLGWEALEAVRNIRSRNWGELTTGNHGLVYQNGEWLFSSSSKSDVQDIFTRTVSIGLGLNENIKIATTTITWQAGSNATKTIELVEQLTNWEAFTNSSCRIEDLTGNWAAPKLLATGASLGSSNTATDVAVKWPYAYVSSVSGTSARADITVYNITNPSAPTLVESLDIGSGGINQMYIQGDYIYASSPNDNKEFIIINISNPLDISETASLNLTGTQNALGVIAFGTGAAVGRLETATNELVFINISNPASPQVVSSLATGGDVNDFAVSNSKLYMVSEQSDLDVWIYDISNPISPTFVATFDIDGVTEDLSVFFHEKNGTTLLVGNEQSEIVSIGATNTAALFVRDRTTFGGWLNDITCVGGDLAFLATEDASREFLVVDLANPDSLVIYGTGLDLPAKGMGIDFANNTVFMAINSSDGFKVIGPQ